MASINKSSQSAKNMAALFQEMRAKEAYNFLRPHLKQLRKKSTRVGGGGSRMPELQALACHWSLNKIPGFWTDNDTEQKLLRTLHNHGKQKMQKEKPVARPVKQERKVSIVVEEAQPQDAGQWKESLRSKATLPAYRGDLFSTRGDYNAGLIYASRRPKNSGDVSRFHMATSHSSSDKKKKDDKSKDDSKKAGSSAQQSALEQLKITSTATLHKLSKDGAYRKDLGSDEAVDAVFRMWANSPNEQVRRNCALTLSNLYTTTAVTRDDVLAPILSLCNDEVDAGVLATCAKALLNRMLSERSLSLGFVPQIISAVRSMKSRCLSETKRDCSQVLKLMLHRAAPRSAAAKPDDDERKGDSKKPELSEEELEAQARKRVLEVAANEGILTLLSSLATDPDDTERQEHCSAALLHMAKLPSVHNDLSGRTVLPVVVSLLQSPSPETCDFASMLMYELVCSSDENVRSRLVHNDTVAEALISVAIGQAGVLTDDQANKDMERSREHVLQMGERATAAILQLTTEPLLLASMVAGGVANALFAWFNYGDDAIKHNCVVSLCNLFACEEGQAALVELGFVRVIISAANIKPLPESKDRLGDDDVVYDDPDVDVGVRKRCSRALCMLSSGGQDLAEHLIAENAVEAVVRLTETIDAEVRLNCVQAFMHLSKWAVSHPAMIQHGAVGALTRFSKSKDSDVLEACTLALCNIARSEDSHHALIEEDVVNTLVRLAGATGLRQQCVSAFCQLSAFRPAHKPIIQQGVLPMLIAQSRFTNSHIRRECAQALYNLSCMVGSEADMVSHGVPAALTIVALFRADDGLTKDLCAAALFNLMFDPAGRQQLMDDGVLWAFIKLALAAAPAAQDTAGKTEQQLVTADTAQTCTRLISNLTCDDAMVKHTIEKRTLAALSKFAPSTNPRTRLNCGNALCEVSRRAHLLVPAIERGILTVVSKLARQRGDLDVAECCATVLFRLTQREDARDKLAAEEKVAPILLSLIRSAISVTVKLAGRASTGPVGGQSGEEHEAELTATKKRVLALKRMLAVIAVNLSGCKQEAPTLISHGLPAVLKVLCKCAGPVAMVPQNAAVSDDVIDCPLADPVAINAVIRTVYNLSVDEDCCALIAETAALPVTTALTHTIAAVAADTSHAVYDDATVELLAIAAVNLSSQDVLAAKLHTPVEMKAVLSTAVNSKSVTVRQGCAQVVTNVLVAAHTGDTAVADELLASMLKAWDASSHGETVDHSTCDTYSFLFWFLSRHEANLRPLVKAGFFHTLHRVVHALFKRQDKTVTEREREALMLESAAMLQRLTGTEELRMGTFDEDAGINAIMELTKNTSPLIQRSVTQSLKDLTLSHDLRCKVVQKKDIVPFLAALANNKQADEDAQALAASALKNISDDTMLAQQGTMSSGGVVASVLRLLPPPTPEGLGVDVGKHEEEEGKADLSATMDGVAAGSFVRGHGKPLNEFPQRWNPVHARPLATVGQEGLDSKPAGEPDWLKIIDLEGVPKPLPEVTHEPAVAAQDGPGSGAPKTTTVLKHQTFQRQKSPRSKLPPLDGEDESKRSTRRERAAREAELAAQQQPPSRTVKGTSPHMMDSRRNGASITPGADGKFSHSQPTLPRVSSPSAQEQQRSRSSAGRRGSGNSTDELYGSKSAGKLPKLQQSPGGAKRTPKRKKRSPGRKGGKKH